VAFGPWEREKEGVARALGLGQGGGEKRDGVCTTQTIEI
jgi:hypothetical protein